MKRRDFLRYSVGLGLASSPLLTIKSFAIMGSNNAGLMPNNAMPAGSPLLTDLSKLHNQSQQAGIFRSTIEAMPIKIKLAGGKETEFWTYNGLLPGPQIVAYEEDIVEIQFTNHLPQPTTIHWHGLDVPNDADGNPQDPVAPGKSKLYRFTLPKGSAGTYWYHPHPHDYVAEQVYKGLAGALVIKAKDDPLADLTEQHWVISDLRLNADGSIPPNSMLDWMNGREGEFILINGQYQPKIDVQTNERIRIWNVTSARYLRLKIEGVQWIVVGTDGGLLEKPRPPVDELFLAPAQRVEAVLIGETKGNTILDNLYYDRQKMMVTEQPINIPLAQISVKSQPLTLPEELRTIPKLGNVKVKREVFFSEEMMHHHGGMHGRNTMSHGSTGIQNSNSIPPMLENMFLVNGKSFDMNRADFTGKIGQVEEWSILNNSHMDHPFHIHGTQFEVVNRHYNGKTEVEKYRALRDVVNLRPFEKIVIRFVQNHSGLKMFHCHILEHENLGMMAMLKVEA